MNNDLTILPIIPEENETAPKQELHPNLPDVYKGQLIALVGGVRMGKGTMWNGFLHNPNFYADLFSTVTVISPTVWNDSTSRFTAKKYKENCHDIYDDSIIEGLIANQIAKKKIDERLLKAYLKVSSSAFSPRHLQYLSGAWLKFLFFIWSCSSLATTSIGPPCSRSAISLR